MLEQGIQVYKVRQKEIANSNFKSQSEICKTFYSRELNVGLFIRYYLLQVINIYFNLTVVCIHFLLDFVKQVSLVKHKYF